MRRLEAELIQEAEASLLGGALAQWQAGAEGVAAIALEARLAERRLLLAAHRRALAAAVCAANALQELRVRETSLPGRGLRQRRAWPAQARPHCKYVCAADVLRVMPPLLEAGASLLAGMPALWQAGPRELPAAMLERAWPRATFPWLAEELTWCRCGHKCTDIWQTTSWAKSTVALQQPNIVRPEAATIAQGPQ